jgi:hypothetical protein
MPNLILATPREWRISERSIYHPLHDDVVCLLCHVHAIPVGKAAWVTPNLCRAIALHAGVVWAIAPAACDYRIIYTCKHDTTNMNEQHYISIRSDNIVNHVGFITLTKGSYTFTCNFPFQMGLIVS